jgi:hypothetical protein
MTVHRLAASPTFTDCSALVAPRSFGLVSTDPSCRVTIITSVDGTVPGPSVLRVLTPASTEVLWEASDLLAFVITAGNDEAPIVTVAGSEAPGGSVGPPAYTLTTAAYTQPPVSSSVQLAVEDTSWIAVGENVYVVGGGYYAVLTVDDATDFTVTNLGVAGNAAPSATVSTTALVTPSGVAGPPGPAGSAGTNGSDAYTRTTASFIQPAVSSNVQLAVQATGGLPAGAPVYVAGGGFYSLVSVDDATHVTVKNLGAAGNAAPSSAVSAAALVMLSGAPGAPTVALAPVLVVENWSNTADHEAPLLSVAPGGDPYVINTPYAFKVFAHQGYATGPAGASWVLTLRLYDTTGSYQEDVAVNASISGTLAAHTDFYPGAAISAPFSVPAGYSVTVFAHPTPDGADSPPNNLQGVCFILRNA